MAIKNYRNIYTIYNQYLKIPVYKNIFSIPSLYIEILGILKMQPI